MAYFQLGLKPVAPRTGTKQLVAPADSPGAADVSISFPGSLPVQITPTTGAVNTPPESADLMDQLKRNPLLLIIGGIAIAYLLSEVL